MEILGAGLVAPEHDLVIGTRAQALLDAERGGLVLVADYLGASEQSAPSGRPITAWRTSVFLFYHQVVAIMHEILKIGNQFPKKVHFTIILDILFLYRK